MNATLSVKFLGSVGVEFFPGCGFKPKAGNVDVRNGLRDVCWPHDEWLVTVTNGDKSMTTTYNTGIGHRKCAPQGQDRRFFYGPDTVKIEIEDVLQSLFLDASSGEESFEDFCDNTGANTDSRKALEMYLKCQETGASLRRLFGAEYATIADEVRDR